MPTWKADAPTVLTALGVAIYVDKYWLGVWILPALAGLLVTKLSYHACEAIELGPLG